jgi:hypothetical protein
VNPGPVDLKKQHYLEAAFWLGRNFVIFVPQTGQLPLAARRPLSIVTSWASFILRLVLHFMQYASTSMP